MSTLAYDAPIEHKGSDVRICVQCGRLHDLKKPQRFGYRQDHTDAPVLERCEHCSSTSLADPSIETTRRVLQEHDDEQDEQRRDLSGLLIRRFRDVALLIAGTMLVGRLAYLCLSQASGKTWNTAFEPSAAGASVVILLVLGVGLLAALLVSLRNTWATTRRLTLPARWKLVRSRGWRGTRDSGPITCATPLYAPLSGRPCAAFEVGVRAEPHAAGPLRTWLLLEQHIAPSLVGARRIDPQRTALQLPREPFDEEAQLHEPHYLHDRGFEGAGVGLFLFESIVPLDATVNIIERRDGTTQLRPT